MSPSSPRHGLPSGFQLQNRACHALWLGICLACLPVLAGCSQDAQGISGQSSFSPGGNDNGNAVDPAPGNSADTVSGNANSGGTQVSGENADNATTSVNLAGTNAAGTNTGGTNAASAAGENSAQGTSGSSNDNQGSLGGGGAKPPTDVGVILPPNVTQDITFDDLLLDLQKDEPFAESKLSPRVKALNAHKIRIRGYILPSFFQEGLTEFILVRDNLACCFGPGAALHDCIAVRMVPGESTNYTTAPVAVEGVFKIDLIQDATGRHMAIYALSADAVD